MNDPCVAITLGRIERSREGCLSSSGMNMRAFARWTLTVTSVCLALHPVWAAAEVTRVVITSQGIVAGGHSFATVGTYEKLVGRIEFALDPADTHNRGIADLAFAPKGPDGRVHFSSDLSVLRPVNQAKGNEVLLFEVANRGGFGGASWLFGMINGGDRHFDLSGLLRSPHVHATQRAREPWDEDESDS